MKTQVQEVQFIMDYEGKRKNVSALIMAPDVDGCQLVIWYIDGKQVTVIVYKKEEISICTAKLLMAVQVGVKKFRPEMLKVEHVKGVIATWSAEQGASNPKVITLERHPRGSVFWNDKMVPHTSYPFVNEIDFFELIATRNRRFFVH